MAEDKAISMSSPPIQEAEDSHVVKGECGIQTTDVCSRCTAVCCRAFSIAVPIKPQDHQWQIDWDQFVEEDIKGRRLYGNQASWEELSEEARKDMEFCRLNWMPVFQPYPGVGKSVSAYVRKGLVNGILLFTCRALDTARNCCSVYEDRPWICRQHICDPVTRHGITPAEALTQGISCTVYPGLAEITLRPSTSFDVTFSDEGDIALGNIASGVAYMRSLLADGPCTSDPFAPKPQAVSGLDPDLDVVREQL